MEKKYDVACIGTCLLDISTSGLDFDTLFVNEPNLAEAISYGSGGDANNQSIVLSRLGHKVSFLSRVGNDFTGKFVLDQVSSAGVDVSHVKISDREPTAENNILIGPNDKRIYIVSKNSTSRTELCGDDIDLDVVRQAKLVSIGSIFVHPKLDKDLEKILKVAKDNGAIICADVCPSGEECSLESLGEVASCLDYLFLNEDEAKYLSGEEEADKIADHFLTRGVGTVIVKLGTKGSYIKSKKEEVFQEAFYAENVVDTTGAGDCFASGFISGVLRGLSLKECAKFATACSFLTIQKIGATTAIEGLKQVEAVLETV